MPTDTSLRTISHYVLVFPFYLIGYIIKVSVTFVTAAGAAFGILSAVVAWVYRDGSERLGVVDLFACEISTLCKVATVVDTAHRNVVQFCAGPPPTITKELGTSQAAAHFTSQENYFPVFEANNKYLQKLEARVVINITAFYTYMKAVRDMKCVCVQEYSQAKQTFNHS